MCCFLILFHHKRIMKRKKGRLSRFFCFYKNLVIFCIEKGDRHNQWYKYGIRLLITEKGRLENWKYSAILKTFLIKLQNHLVQKVIKGESLKVKSLFGMAHKY